MTRYYVCSFFGHRKIEKNNEIIEKLSKIVEDLIVNKNVRTFLFGTKSEFNTLCHSIVSRVKEKYTYIKRIGYPCKSETFFLENEKEKFKKIYRELLNDDSEIYAVEEIKHFKSIDAACKASYVERNFAMIDDSDFCVFYYNNSYKPKAKGNKRSKMYDYQPNSGTKIAYEYANKKHKAIINILNC